MSDRIPSRLGVYAALSRALRTSYRTKILLVAFAGTHVPLLSLVGYEGVLGAESWREGLAVLLTALVATLAGTGFTLFALDRLLQPVFLTGSALRRYRERQEPCTLPVTFPDEVGALMADTRRTLEHLDATLDGLRHLDHATGLANRSRFESWLAERAAVGRPFTVAVVRAAAHPRWVETLGTREGDAGLQVLAERLRDCPRVGAHLARVGPDQLAALIDEAGDTVVESIRATVDACDAEPVELGGLAVRPGLLAGLASWPADVEDGGSLLDHAQHAATAATPEARVMACTPALRRSTLERFRVEHELRRAIDQGELVLHYQPIVDAATGRVVSAEALVRWQHPERGLLYPGAFVPIAEASGLMEPMGRWVLQRACAQLRAWADDGRRVRLAVNLSAREFGDPGLVALVRSAVHAAHISADQLEFELTETAAMADLARTREVFGQLRDDGVGIAIDDFGTGHSSLAWLRRLPFDKLKIDREFVSNVHTSPANQAICDALLALARGLQLQSLAEGVEQPGEVAWFARRGCRSFQGYWFGKPVPPDVFAAGLDRVFAIDDAPDAVAVAK